MGEYAKRYADDQEVKIGTCECMYYLRFDQRHEVRYDFTDTYYLFRIPTPDEDGIKPGAFEFKGLQNDTTPWRWRLGLKPFTDEGLVSQHLAHKGLVQVYQEKLGMLVNVPCYHGLKLPEGTDDIKFHWNGKKEVFYLTFLVNREELQIGVQCLACGLTFSLSFDEIEPYIKSLWMKLRLLHQCTEYWYEHKDTRCQYVVEAKDCNGYSMKVYNEIGHESEWVLEIAGVVAHRGYWEDVRNEFISRLRRDAGQTSGEERAEIMEAQEMYDRYIEQED